MILQIKQWLQVDRIDKSRVREMINSGKTEGAGDREVKQEKKVPVPSPVVVKRENPDQERVSSVDSAAISREKLNFIRRSLEEILTILDKHDKK